MTVTRTANGIQVDSSIDTGIFDTEDDYKISNQKLYVFGSQPTVEQLRGGSPENAYQYGQEIPVDDADGVVWIVNNTDLEMLTRYVTNLSICNFDEPDAALKTSDPEKYRKDLEQYQAYVYYQEFSDGTASAEQEAGAA